MATKPQSNQDVKMPTTAGNGCWLQSLAKTQPRQFAIIRLHKSETEDLSNRYAHTENTSINEENIRVSLDCMGLLAAFPAPLLAALRSAAAKDQYLLGSDNHLTILVRFGKDSQNRTWPQTPDCNRHLDTCAK